MIRVSMRRCIVGVAGGLLVAIAMISPAPASAEEASPADSDTAVAAEEATFGVWEFRIEGSALLPPAQVERVVMPFMGERKTSSDIERAREAVEAAYRAAGFPTVFVDVPEQEVTDGVVRLHVTEGRVTQMKVTGSRYFSPRAIGAAVPALAEGQVPYLPAVQDQIAGVNARTSDRVITPVLRPGKTPGSLEVELKVSDELPLHGDIEINDRYAEGTTKSRLNASLRYDNLFQRQHSLSVQYQTAPEKTKEVRVLAGTYVARFADTDDLGVIYGVHSESDTATVGTLAVIGKGDIVGLRGIVPLSSNPGFVHNVSLGLDVKDFKQSVQLQGADATNTPTKYVSWAAQYGATHQSEQRSVRVELGTQFGLRALNDEQIDCERLTDANNDGFQEVVVDRTSSFDCKRSGARPNYMKWMGAIEASDEFLGGAQWWFQFTGQLADSPLISNEEFSAGGAGSVRGYYESQVLGDQGWNARAELRTRSYADVIGGWAQNLRLLAFVDGAKTAVRDPLPGETTRFEMYSVGYGLRASAWTRWSMELDWARALHTQRSVARGDVRWHGSLQFHF